MQRLKDYVKLMSKFNVHIDIIIRRKYSSKQNEDLYELYDGKLIDLPKILKKDEDEKNQKIKEKNKQDMIMK